MRKTSLLFAGAAALALAAGSAASAQSYSWGNSETTYFHSPSTTDTYSASQRPAQPIIEGPLGAPETRNVVPQGDPMFYRAPDSYGVYRGMPGADSAVIDQRYGFYDDDGEENLGQGSGMYDRFGR